MNKHIKIIVNILLIIIIILIGLYALFKITNKVEIYKVETGSMEDNIHVGDYILIHKQSDYEVDDVVTFVVNGYHVTHRIIEIDEDKVTTKGDANNVEDESISKKDIVGKVIISGGILNFVVNYKYLLISMVLIGYLITCFVDKKEKEKLKEKEILKIKKKK